jgi:hypothetical protein
MIVLLLLMLLLRCHNSVGWRLVDKAARLTVVSCWPGLFEQNKVLLWQTLGRLLVRGCCRQAWITGGEPC